MKIRARRPKVEEKIVIDWGKVFARIGLLIVISVFIELTVCNLRYWQSLGYRETDGFEIHYNDGVVHEKEDIYHIEKDKNNTIEITNIDEETNNIYIDIEKVNYFGDENENYYKTTTVVLSRRDEANNQYQSLNERTLVNGYDRSKCIKLNLNGKVKSILIDLRGNEDAYLRIKSIRLNVHAPFEIVLLRILGIAVCGTLVWIILNVKVWKSIEFDKCSRCQLYVGILLVVSQLMIMEYIASANPFFGEMFDTNQYTRITEALAEGKAYIDCDVDEKLMEMENPYDTGERSAIGVNYEWDYSFYNGKYYVYFGVVPALLVYLPYFKLTGHHIVNYMPTLIACMGSAVFLFMLLRKLADKYFKRIPVLLLYLSYLLCVNAIGCPFMVARPNVYECPIAYGLMFTLIGLYSWLCAVDKEGWDKSLCLFVGAICMALVAGCRPQFLLASFFIIPMFVIDGYHKLRNKDKKVIREVMAIAVPYIIVAIGIMYYNNIRFDSPFNFGVNYTLTTNDMTHRGWKADRIGLGIFEYLFSPIPVSSNFPFMLTRNVHSLMQGTTIWEPMYGGALAICPIILVSAYGVTSKKLFDDKRIKLFTIMSMIFAIIVIVVDTQMAGILYRYLADFMVFLLIPAVLTLFAVEASIKDNELYCHIMQVAVLLIVYSIFFNQLLYFAPNGQDLRSHNAEVFYKLFYRVQFWV